MLIYQIVLACMLLAAVGLSAIGAANYGDWILEVVPVIFAFPALYFIGKKFRLSNISYTLLFLYFLLPVIQGHYGVAHVPAGFELSKILGVTRNSFDRVTHFAFGLVMVLPVYEILAQVLESSKTVLRYFMSFSIIMMGAAVYECIELAAHLFLSKNLSFLFVGGQADFWDTSNDIAMSLIGALITLIIVFIVAKISHKRKTS